METGCSDRKCENDLDHNAAIQLQSSKASCRCYCLIVVVKGRSFFDLRKQKPQIMFVFLLNRKVEDLQFRVEEACITKGDLEVNVQHKSMPVQPIHVIGITHFPVPVGVQAQTI